MIIEDLESRIECLVECLKNEYNKKEQDEELIIKKENKLCDSREELENFKAGRISLENYYEYLEYELTERGLIHILYE